MNAQINPVKLVGVYKADGGFRGEVVYVVGHLFGLKECSLCDITHSPLRRKPSWDAAAARLKSEFGLDFELVHMNERSPSILKATTGREPCVLAEYEDGSVTMMLDARDLKIVAGSVSKFEKLIQARLALFF